MSDEPEDFKPERIISHKEAIEQEKQAVLYNMSLWTRYMDFIFSADVGSKPADSTSEDDGPVFCESCGQELGDPLDD